MSNFHMIYSGKLKSERGSSVWFQRQLLIEKDVLVGRLDYQGRLVHNNQINLLSFQEHTSEF